MESAAADTSSEWIDPDPDAGSEVEEEYEEHAEKGLDGGEATGEAGAAGDWERSCETLKGFLSRMLWRGGRVRSFGEVVVVVVKVEVEEEVKSMPERRSFRPWLSVEEESCSSTSLGL